MEKMKAIFITGVNETKLGEANKPQINDDQVLMRIKACAICTWEQRAFVGEKKVPYPFLGGHEISGVIEKIGKNVDPKNFPIGAKCVGRTQIACGSCYNCRRGEFAICEHLADYRYNGPDYYGFGGMAEYIALNVNSVFVFPEGFSFEVMSITEPVACVLNSIHIAKPKLGDDAVIIGGGVMGQIHIKILHKMGLRTILSEPDKKRREFALKNGCDFAIDPLNEDLEKKVKEITHGIGAETVINTTPIPKLEQQALTLLAPLGTLVTYSSQHPDAPVSISPNWLHNVEPTITGAVNPSFITFNQAINLVGKKIINIDDIVTKSYSMNESNEAFKQALSMDTYRIVIKMEE